MTTSYDESKKLSERRGQMPTNLDKLTTYAIGCYAGSLLLGGLALGAIAPIPLQSMLTVMTPLCVGALLSDYLLGPKLLNPHSRPSRRWGELGWLWVPYRWIVGEFGQAWLWVPFLGTGVRLILALSVPAIGVGVLWASGLPVAWAWSAIAHYPGFWAFLGLGLEVAAIIHNVIRGLEEQVRQSLNEPTSRVVVLRSLLNSAVDINKGVCNRCGSRHQYLRHYPYTAGLHRDWCPVPELSEFLNGTTSLETTKVG